MAKNFTTTANLTTAEVCDMLVLLNNSGIRNLMRVVDRTSIRGRKGGTIVTVEDTRTRVQSILSTVGGTPHALFGGLVCAMPVVHKALKTDVEAMWNGNEPLTVTVSD